MWCVMMRSTPMIGVKLQVISSLQSPIYVDVKYSNDFGFYVWLVHFLPCALPLGCRSVCCNSVSVLKAHPRSVSGFHHINSFESLQCDYMFQMCAVFPPIRRNAVFLLIRLVLAYACILCSNALTTFCSLAKDMRDMRDLQDTYFKMIMHNLSIYYNYLCDSMQFSNALRCNEK